MASLPNLLRDSKINALKERLRRLRSQPKVQQQQHQQEPQNPKPAEVLRTFTAAKKRQDSASALHNKECFNKLWALGREPDRLVANPRLHVINISQIRPRRTGPEDVRKQSLLALEVRPEDVVDVEMVDGWSLSSDDLEEHEEEEEGGAEADDAEEAGNDSPLSVSPQCQETSKCEGFDRPNHFSVANLRSSDSDQEEEEKRPMAVNAEQTEKVDPAPSQPLYENLREEEKSLLGLLRFFDRDCNAEVKEDPSMTDMSKGLSRSNSNGGWDNTVWVVDADNSSLGYSQSGNGYWIKW